MCFDLVVCLNRQRNYPFFILLSIPLPPASFSLFPPLFFLLSLPPSLLLSRFFFSAPPTFSSLSSAVSPFLLILPISLFLLSPSLFFLFPPLPFLPLFFYLLIFSLTLLHSSSSLSLYLLCSLPLPFFSFYLLFSSPYFPPFTHRMAYGVACPPYRSPKKDSIPF